MGSAATIYLIRHAKAGERRTWIDDDVERPLSGKGQRQAETIAERLAPKRVTELYSSSYVRCVQTLQPLADRLGVHIQTEKRLAENEPFEPVLNLISEVPAGSVLCSHGDIIPAVITALHRRGMEFHTPVDWRKGSIWVLRRSHGIVVKGKVWPPAIG